MYYYPLAHNSHYLCYVNSQYNSIRGRSNVSKSLGERAILFESLFQKAASIQKQYRCGFGGMQLKIEMNLKMAKRKIDFLI
jgi:hypothetical protein